MSVHRRRTGKRKTTGTRGSAGSRQAAPADVQASGGAATVTAPGTRRIRPPKPAPPRAEAVAAPTLVEGERRTDPRPPKPAARPPKPPEPSRGPVAEPGRLATRRDRVQRLYRDTLAEMKKINWPDRETTKNLTIVVIGISTVLGILLGGIDFLLQALFEVLP